MKIFITHFLKGIAHNILSNLIYLYIHVYGMYSYIPITLEYIINYVL